MRVVYVPWIKNQDLATRMLAWRLAYFDSDDHKKRFIDVFFPNKLKFAKWSAQLYMVGHGKLGGNDAIWPTTSLTGGGSLTASDLATRIEEAGLPDDFRGKVKLYVCYGGAGPEQHNFAANFAKIFSQKYPKCSIFAYEDALKNPLPKSDVAMRMDAEVKKTNSLLVKNSIAEAKRHDPHKATVGFLSKPSLCRKQFYPQETETLIMSSLFTQMEGDTDSTSSDIVETLD